MKTSWSPENIAAMKADFEERISRPRNNEKQLEGKEEADQRVVDYEESLRKLDVSYDELLHRTATSAIWGDDMEDAYKTTNDLCAIYEELIDLAQSSLSAYLSNHKEGIESIADTALQQIYQALSAGRDIERSHRASVAANAKHSKPNGSRHKREQICEIWASGKYTSRDICAEQECAALNMSFSTARKALRNTPTP